MARYSDSDEDRKKHKKKKKHRSRSKSPESTSSSNSHHHKKSKNKSKKRKRKSRSPSTVSHSSSRRSRSRDRSSRKSKSRSRSRERSRDKDYDRKEKKSRDRGRSKDRDLDRYQRSGSRDKKSDYRSTKRSRSRSRGSRRSRSRSRGSKRSRSRDRRSRSRDRSHSSKRYEKGSYHSKSPEIKQEPKETKKDDPCAKIPGFAEMEPSEQAKIRLKMALQAAAAADEQLRKMQDQSTQALDQQSIKEQPNFAAKVEKIENAGFSQATFTSGALPKKVKREPKQSFEDKSHDEAIFGVISDIKLEDKANTDSLAEKIPSNVDIDAYAHPSLFIDVAEKKKKWIQKLCAFRKKRLTGVILS